MPEGLEAAIYARAASELIGHRIVALDVDERCADRVEMTSLVGHQIEGVQRHGKRVALVLDHARLEMYFGMTGRLIVNDSAPIVALEYGPSHERREWDRLAIMTDRGSMRVNDPRRWARFSLDPDWSKLGVDLMADERDLEAVLHVQRHRQAAIKAILLDQRIIAGLGNMLADEVLFCSGIDPRRSISSLVDQEWHRLIQQISMSVAELGGRGGSHTGNLHPGLRSALAACPIDGAPLLKTKVSGRTTIFCSQHQR